MKKLLAILLALPLLFIAVPAQADEDTFWKDMATSAINEFVEKDPGNLYSFAYGMATGAAANVYGWEDPRTITLLNRLRAGKNPDGGYGLGRSYDFGGDGTFNPPTTTYAVTNASHVGFTLLDGYKHGVVAREEVQSLVTQLVRFPRVPNISPGQCVAYSNNKNDINRCVHNVNAGVGDFLRAANIEGFGATGMYKLITDITVHTAVRYRSANAWWPYYNNMTDQDSDHQSYTAESMYYLAYFVGREAAYQQMQKAYTDIAQGPIVHIRLAGLPGGVGSWSTTDPDKTMWCEQAEKWKSEATTYLNAQILLDRIAQVAYYASRNVKSCEG